MLPLIPWDKPFPARERYNCYEANECFVEYIKENNPDVRYFDVKTIEYGYLYDDLAEYNANRMHPGNRFASPISWDPAAYLIHCDWKTFQAMMKNRVIDEEILGCLAAPNLIRKLYSSLSDENKKEARLVYDAWTIKPRETSHNYVVIANCLQFIKLGS